MQPIENKNPTHIEDTLHRWMIVTGVMLAAVLEILDSTIVNIALPHMMGAFGAAFDQITWVLTSYIVAAAVFMPISGFLINRLGSKKLLLINIIGFMVTSMLCGTATSLTQMVFYRILQGVFGASLVPLSQFILRNTFLPDELTKAMAVWGIGIMSGPVLGPTIGGYITETLNWRWIFYINLPICLIDILICLKYIPETPTKLIKTDLLGIALLFISVGCLQLFLDRGNTDNWFDSVTIQRLFIIFIISFIGFIVHSFTHKNPIINLKLFLNLNFSTSCFLLAVFVAGIIGIVSIQPLFLENYMNYPANYAGLVMAPRGITSAITMAFVPKLTQYFKSRTLIGIGIIVGSVSSYLFSLLNLDVDPNFFIWIGAVQGIGMGLFFVPISAIAFATLSQHDYAEASGIFSFCRNAGMSIGISLIATIISRHSQKHWLYLTNHINDFNSAIKYSFINSQHINLHDKMTLAQLTSMVESQAATLSFLDIYRYIFAVLILSLPLIYFLTKKKPSHNFEH